MKPIKKYGYIFSRVDDCISCGLYNLISEQRGICIDCILKECPKAKYYDFEQARTFVRKQNIRNQQDWFTWCKTKKRPANIPVNPHYVYSEARQGGWTDWRDWLGPRDKWISYKVLKEFVKGLGLRSVIDYNRWYVKSNMKSYTDKIGCRLPSNPNKVYEEWDSWNSFLNPKPKFLSFYKARKFARGLKLKSYKEWLEWCRAGYRPDNIPVNPYSTYHDKFLGYPDFLGFKPYRKRKNKNLKG